MNICRLEIANFRKLHSVRIDVSEKTTVLVGANNSGKTSAMLLLRKFLVEKNPQFRIQDVTLSNWKPLIELGEHWEATQDLEYGPAEVEEDKNKWRELLPALDIWFSAELNEIHRVIALVPTLDWEGGEVGVRLQLEPKDVKELRTDYLAQRRAMEELRKKCSPAKDHRYLGPTNLKDYLEKNLGKCCTKSAFTLDPAKCAADGEPYGGRQDLIGGVLAHSGDPLQGLIRVDEINAQRGLGDEDGSSARKLSEQLKRFYTTHLDFSEFPDVTDLSALEALETARQAFEERLTASFDRPIREVENMGYPGITDPKLRLSTQLSALETISHESALTFALNEDDSGALFLPESYNGLGYQNLICMMFLLMSFRAARMREGKAAKKSPAVDYEPIHLVLVEEPEAHLHAQVQQVFVRKAHSILRDHDELGDDSKLQTQVIISTHSSHVAHETKFDCLRYFRRARATKEVCVPTSSVVNLSRVFSQRTQDEVATKKFVTRYLQIQHTNLFFADAAILVEGAAERMLVPHFIRRDYKDTLSCRYLSLLEIHGSHAHRLRPLLEKLGIPALVITDLDSKSKSGGCKTVPSRDPDHESSNDTLNKWIPAKASIIELVDLPNSDKIAGKTRVAYPVPVMARFPDSQSHAVEAIPYTFEDAIVLDNLSLFRSHTRGAGMMRKFLADISNSASLPALQEALFKSIGEASKAQFALDLVYEPHFETLKVPTYIRDGLDWLQEQFVPEQTVGSVGTVSNS